MWKPAAVRSSCTFSFHALEATGLESLAADLERLRPAELLVAEDAPPLARNGAAGAVRERPPWHFESAGAERQLCEQFGTRDLAGFWATSYFDVRKDLRGRYPRHPWPENPLVATPTRRAKPRGT